MRIENDLIFKFGMALRVRGTTGLRVIDSSVMPTSPAGHTHTPSMMIGEMGAGFVLDDAHQGRCPSRKLKVETTLYLCYAAT